VVVTSAGSGDGGDAAGSGGGGVLFIHGAGVERGRGLLSLLSLFLLLLTPLLDARCCYYGC